MTMRATHHPGMTTATALALLLAAAVASPQAQSQAVPPSRADAREVLPAGQLDMARLLDLAAQRLHLAVEYDPGVVKGSATLRLGGAVSDRELWELANRLLGERGLTTVRPAGGGPLAVVKLADAARVARLEPAFPVREPGEADGGGAPQVPQVLAGFITAVYQPGRRPAKEIVDAAAAVLGRAGGGAAASGGAGAGGGSAAAIAVGESGVVLISDLTPRVEQAWALLLRLDGPGQETVVKEVPALNVPPAQLAQLATQVSAKRDAVAGSKAPGEVLPSPNGQAVLVIAPQARVAYWEGLIASLDRREPATTVSYTPRYFGVREVAKLIEQSVREGPGMGGGPAGGPTGAGGAGAGIGGGGLTDDRWRLVTDELTGTLVVTATPLQHEKIAELVERLNSVSAAARRPVRSYKVKNRNVKELTAVLENLIRSGVLDAGAQPAEGGPGLVPAAGVPRDAGQRSDRAAAGGGPSIQGAPAAPLSAGVTEGGYPPDRSQPGTRAVGVAGSAGPGATGPTSPALTLTADEGTGTIIAMGEPRLLAQLDTLIGTLDVRQPQVMLEVLLLSLNDTQALSLGVELEKIKINGDTAIRLSSLFGLSSAVPGGYLGEGARTRSAGDSQGFNGVVLDPGDFSVVVRALETLNHGRSLSTPKVLVSNNQQATFNAVLQQPYSSTNASNTVTTTSFGGTQDAGTTVSIRPQIAEGDHLLLEYQVALSSFVGSPGAQGLPPPRQQNSVQSTVSIPDGFTVVVGGLELESRSEAISQVPLLGDIPLIGELFKSRNTNASTSRFFVFIRANVLRGTGFEDLKYASEGSAEVGGIDDGWPVLRPRVIR